MGGTVVWVKILRFDVVVGGFMICGAHSGGGKLAVYEGMPFAATLLRCSW